MKFFIYLLLFGSITACHMVTKTETEHSPSTSKDRLTHLANRAVVDIDKIPYDSLHIPRSLKDDNSLKGTSSRSWTSGFYAGMLWQLYAFSKDEKLKDAAIQWQAVVEKEKWDSGTHDLGFKLYCSFGQSYKITQAEESKDVFLTAARTLSTRYNSKIGAIRSWDHHEELWKYPVIIDNMMNLEMLFEASLLTGDSSFYHIARQHALTTLKNHFRTDNSSYHVVDYNPDTGEVVQKNTHQGAFHESAWSRGQAWGLYGFLVAYRYTKEEIFLQQAQEIAIFIFTHPNLPDDYIPYWDFNAPNIPNEPRDVSAASIMASALIELSEYDRQNTAKYLAWADRILKSLQSEKYQCETAPFFLKHSIGSIPGQFEIDNPIIYADYYYVEALSRRDIFSQKF